MKQITVIHTIERAVTVTVPDGFDDDELLEILKENTTPAHVRIIDIGGGEVEIVEQQDIQFDQEISTEADL